MIRLTCDTVFATRRGELPSSREFAGGATCTGSVFVAVGVLGARAAHLGAGVSVTALCGRIIVVIELSLVCAYYWGDGTLGAVCVSGAVDALRRTVRVGIRFAGSTLNALADVDSSGSLPVLTRQTSCTWCRRTRIAVSLTSHALSTLGLAAASVCAGLAGHTVSGRIGVMISSTR